MSDESYDPPTGDDVPHALAAALKQAIDVIDDLGATLREIDERILEDTSGGILQRWDRLDRLLKLKEKAVA